MLSLRPPGVGSGEGGCEKDVSLGEGAHLRDEGEKDKLLGW